MFVDLWRSGPISIEGPTDARAVVLNHITAQVDDRIEVIRVDADTNLKGVLVSLGTRSKASRSLVVVDDESELSADDQDRLLSAAMRSELRCGVVPAVPLPGHARIIAAHSSAAIVATIEPSAIAIQIPWSPPQPADTESEASADAVAENEFDPATLERLAEIMEPRPVEVRRLGDRIELTGVALRPTTKAAAILSYLAFHRHVPIDMLQMEFFADKADRNALDTAIGNIRLSRAGSPSRRTPPRRSATRRRKGCSPSRRPCRRSRRR